jgi:hypothetical protein
VEEEPFMFGEKKSKRVQTNGLEWQKWNSPLDSLCVFPTTKKRKMMSKHEKELIEFYYLLLWA